MMSKDSLLRYCFIILMFILLSVSAAWAEHVVRVGLYQNSPKVAVSEVGKPEGVFVDLIEAIAAQEGWSLQYVPGTWAQGLDRLATGEIDLMPDVAFTKAREEKYSFHHEPVLSDWFQVYTRRGAGIRSILDLNGKRVAVLERSIQQEAFSKALVGFDLHVVLVPLPDYSSAFTSVVRGDVDAVITNRFYGAAHIREFKLEDTAIIFSPTGLFFAAPKSGNVALLNAIDEHLARYKKDPSSIYYQSLRRWTSENVEPWFPLWLKGAMVVAAILMLFSLLWSVVLKHQVAARTRELVLRNEELQAAHEQMKEAEGALHQSEQEYRELVESANSIILRWTCDGIITFLNDFGLRFFGYSADEIIGRHVAGTIVPATDTDGRNLSLLMDQILTNPIAFEKNINENMRRNGERVWIAWANRIVHDGQGQVAEILSIGTDITELKQAEEAIRELNTTLEERVAERTAELAVARDRAESADRLKSAFLATMSHELRTPLNSIIGFTGIMLQGLAGPLTAEQRKQLSMVQGSSRHLLSLINDVLDISKIEAGQLEVSRELCDLRALIEKTINTVRPLAEKMGLALHVKIAPEIGPLLSDPRRVEQILLNILNNAIKFTEEGSVTVRAEIVAAQIHISVTDTGIGIKPEELSRLFQPFRQIDTGLSRQREGTGLGLAICRRLSELLGGEIFAVSEWGRGSVFTLILPMNRVEMP
jgi:PAS domain S-box-containing protein